MSNPQFRVTGHLTLPSRHLFALRGEIVAGTIRRGMLVEFNVREAFGISAPIAGVEFIDGPDGRSEVALTFVYQDDAERTYLEEFAPTTGETCEIRAAPSSE